VLACMNASRLSNMVRSPSRPALVDAAWSMAYVPLHHFPVMQEGRNGEGFFDLQQRRLTSAEAEAKVRLFPATRVG